MRVAIGVWQVVSPGPNSSNVTLPVGEKPPDTVAESAMLPPAGTLLGGVVEIDGLAFGTCSVIDSLKPGAELPLSRKFTVQCKIFPGTADGDTVTSSLKSALSPLVTVRLAGVSPTVRSGSQALSE